VKKIHRKLHIKWFGIVKSRLPEQPKNLIRSVLCDKRFSELLSYRRDTLVLIILRNIILVNGKIHSD